MVLKGLPPDVREDLRRFMKRIDRLDTSAVEKRRLRWWIVTIRERHHRAGEHRKWLSLLQEAKNHENL